MVEKETGKTALSWQRDKIARCTGKGNMLVFLLHVFGSKGTVEISFYSRRSYKYIFSTTKSPSNDNSLISSSALRQACERNGRCIAIIGLSLSARK